MLYISTRDPQNTFTSYTALCEKYASDGGAFLPFHMAPFMSADILALKDTSFNQTVADILNLFFTARLTAWDVELCLGKTPSTTTAMNYKISIAELWHNPKGDVRFFENALYSRICEHEKIVKDCPWAWIAIKIAILFGLYGQLQSQDHVTAGGVFDVVVDTEDFIAPFAAWYARYMGLPIHHVICLCNEDSNIWELVHRGAFSGMKATDKLMRGVEALIYLTLGHDEVTRFIKCMKDGSIYSLDDEQQAIFSAGMFCSVTGANRDKATISSLFRSSGYIASPKTALRYGALQDYRAATGSSLRALLIADDSPLNNAATVSDATGVDQFRIRELIEK